MCACAHICRGQQRTSGILSLPYSFETGSVTDPELGWWPASSSNAHVWPAQCWDYKWVETFGFLHGYWSLNSNSPGYVDLIHEAISPTPDGSGSYTRTVMVHWAIRFVFLYRGSTIQFPEARFYFSIGGSDRLF